MDSPHHSTTFATIGSKWTATVQTPEGPLTAVGDSMGEAKSALDALLVIARALAVTRRHDH